MRSTRWLGAVAAVAVTALSFTAANAAQVFIGTSIDGGATIIQQATGVNSANFGGVVGNFDLTSASGNIVAPANFISNTINPRQLLLVAPLLCTSRLRISPSPVCSRLSWVSLQIRYHRQYDCEHAGVL